VSLAACTPPRAGSITPPQSVVGSSPIPALRARPPRPDTLAVVSAAALPRAAVWRLLAQRLPPGSVLLVTAGPQTEGR
jgi:hypothetical protein